MPMVKGTTMTAAKVSCQEITTAPTTVAVNSKRDETTLPSSFATSSRSCTPSSPSSARTGERCFWALRIRPSVLTLRFR